MQSGERLAATKHVEESADYSGVSGQQHEAPLEHRRLRCGADVDCDEQQRDSGQRKPQEHYAFQHPALPYSSAPARDAVQALSGVKQATRHSLSITGPASRPVGWTVTLTELFAAIKY